MLLASPYADVTALLANGGLHADLQVSVNGCAPLPAHRAILALRAPYFERLFAVEAPPPVGAAVQLPVGCGADAAHAAAMLRYVYGGVLEVRRLSDVPPLLAVAGYLMVDVSPLRRRAVRELVFAPPPAGASGDVAALLRPTPVCDGALLDEVACVAEARVVGYGEEEEEGSSLSAADPRDVGRVLALAAVAGAERLHAAAAALLLRYDACPAAVRACDEDPGGAERRRGVRVRALLMMARNVHQDVVALRGGCGAVTPATLALDGLAEADVWSLLDSPHLNVQREDDAALLAARLLRKPWRRSSGGVDRGDLRCWAVACVAACGAAAAAAAGMRLRMYVRVVPRGLAGAEWEVSRLQVVAAGGEALDLGEPGTLQACGEFASGVRCFAAHNLLAAEEARTWSAPQHSSDDAWLQLHLALEPQPEALLLRHPPHAPRPAAVAVLTSRDGVQFREVCAVKVFNTRTSKVSLSAAVQVAKEMLYGEGDGGGGGGAGNGAGDDGDVLLP